MQVFKAVQLLPPDIVKIEDMVNGLFPENHCSVYYTNDREISFDMFQMLSRPDGNAFEVFHWLEICNNIIAPKIYEILKLSNADSYIAHNVQLIENGIIDYLYDLYLIAKHC